MFLKQTIVTLLAAITATQAGNAPQVADSTPGTKYVADFSGQKNVQGSVEFVALNNGSVQVNVNVNSLPSAGGPFLYHIHQKPVPSDGNCTGTLGHLNPYNGSETATTPAAKEVGDLSGKHGLINGQSLNTSYVDPYISLNPDDKAFFGDLSVVFHLNNTTRIACANLTKEDNEVPSSSSASSSAAPSASSKANAVSGMNAGGALLGAAAVAVGMLI